MTRIACSVATFFALLLSFGSLSAEPVASARPAEVRAAEASPGEIVKFTFPRIAKNQLRRPTRIRTNPEDFNCDSPPCETEWEGGACNCSRACGGYACVLANPCYACRHRTGQPCEGCAQSSNCSC
jgi:hypothetical protein